MATGYTPPGATCCCGGGACGACACSPMPAEIDLDLSGLTLAFGAGGCSFSGLVLPLSNSEGAPCVWQTDGYLGTGCNLASPCADEELLVGAAFGFACPGTTTLDIQFASVTDQCVFLLEWSEDFLTADDRAAAGIDCSPFSATLTGFPVVNASGPGACLCAAGGLSVSGSVTLAPSPGMLALAAAAKAAPRLMAAAGGGGRGQSYRPPPPARPRVCLYADRVEFLAGCSGFRCRHRCTSPDPGVRAALGESDIVLPADECQTCPGFTPRP